MQVIYHHEVEKRIRSLPRTDRARIIKVVDLFIDYQFAVTELYLKKLTKGVWELRAGKWRMLFGMINTYAFITVLFYKQTQKTPKKEIELSIRRLNSYEK